MRRILLIGLLLVPWAMPAQAAVILTQEWNGPGRPAGGWSYNTVDRPAIDCSVTPSPSGGCALKFTHLAGTQTTSTNGGRAAYDGATITGEPTDLYIGEWKRYSSNFVVHPNGWKRVFFIRGGSSENVSFGWSSTAIAVASQVNWTSNPNFPANAGSWDFNSHRNEWHWFESRVRLGTAGACQDTIQMWIDDALKVDYSNVCFRPAGNTRGIAYMQHTSEFGGGGTITIPEQYQWTDHTVFSTTRIGMPGGSTPTDSTPPGPVQNFRVQ